MAPIVQSLNEEWASIADSPTARRALMRWTTAHPDLAWARSVDDLVDIRSHPTRGRDAHRTLAAEAPVDHLAARTLLQALLGGLVCLSHKVGDGDADVVDELVSMAWMRIPDLPVVSARCGCAERAARCAQAVLPYEGPGCPGDIGAPCVRPARRPTEPGAAHVRHRDPREARRSEGLWCRQRFGSGGGPSHPCHGRVADRGGG